MRLLFFREPSCFCDVGFSVVPLLLETHSFGEAVVFLAERLFLRSFFFGVVSLQLVSHGRTSLQHKKFNINYIIVRYEYYNII